MPKYKRLSDDDLLLVIDRTRIEIDGQRQIVARLAARAVGSWDETGHRRLVDTHILVRAMLESDLTKMEAEWQRRK